MLCQMMLDVVLYYDFASSSLPDEKISRQCHIIPEKISAYYNAIVQILSIDKIYLEKASSV